MSDESKPVLAAKAMKNAVVRRLPRPVKVAGRDAYHRTRLRLGNNPLGRPDDHERFLKTHLHHVGRPGGLTYLEFGVYQGASLAATVRAMDRDGRPARFFGFDSFEGLPPGSKDEGWGDGWFVTSRRTAEWNLRRQHALDRVELIEGWFEDTCTAALAERIGTVDVVMFDCDIYSATATAVRFVEPLLAPSSLLIFDDFAAFNAAESTTIGQARAFEEFRVRHESATIERLGNVGHCGVGFLVTNTGPTSPR